jgi:hypothetical protein
MTIDDLIADLRLYDGNREIDILIVDTSKCKPDGDYLGSTIFTDPITQKVFIAADRVQLRCRVSGTKPDIETIK